MYSIDAFAGTGALTLGLKQAGVIAAALIERDRHRCEALRSNARLLGLEGTTAILERDIREVDFRPYRGIDIVAGGPPCQPFSSGGQGRGQQDPRDMFPEAIRAVRECRPKAFLFENVPGVLAPRHRDYLDHIIMQLQLPTVTAHSGESWQSHAERLKACLDYGIAVPLQYEVHVLPLNAADFGVAQSRKRVFILGFRSDLAASWAAPVPTHERPPRRVKGVCATPGVQVTMGNTRKTGGLRPWRSIRDVVHDLPAFGTSEAEALEHRFRSGARPYPGHTGSPYDGPSKTLKAGVHGVPGGENMIAFGSEQYRYMSIREAARVQSFPDVYRFDLAWSRALRLLGNAVPVTLATVVAHSVAEVLRSADARRQDEAA